MPPTRLASTNQQFASFTPDSQAEATLIQIYQIALLASNLFVQIIFFSASEAQVQVRVTLYTATELPAFDSKIENQVIPCRTHL